MAGESESKHSLRREILLLLLLAFVLRAGPLVLIPRVIDSPDAVYYLTEAEKYSRWALSDLDPKIPPLYPFLTAVLHVLIPDLEWAARIVSLIFSTLTIVPVYLLGREMHGRASARVAAILVSIWPWLMDYGGRVTTEALATFLWFLALWLFARGMRAHVGWIVAAALVFFGLHLTRPEGTFVLLAAIPAAFILTYRDSRVELKRLIPFIAIAALTLSAYALWMRQLAGEATLNYRLGFVLDKPEGSTVLTDFVKTFSGMIGEVPAIMLGPFLWMFAGVGLIGTVSEEKGQSTRSKTRLGQSRTKEKRDFRLETYVLFFALVQWLIVLVNLSPAPRYIMAFLIVALFWSARGIVGVGELARNLPGGKLLRHAPLGFIIAIMAFHYGVTTAAEVWPGRTPQMPHEYKIAGRWMKENLEPGLIMTRKPQVGYYAGMQSFGPYLADTIDDVLKTAREGEFRYLVVDERNTAVMVPGLAPLLDPKNAPAGLELLSDDLSPYSGARVVIYKFVHQN